MSTDSSLLATTLKVEAAVKAYIRVQDFTDEAEWRARFRRKFVSAHMCGILHGVLINLHLKWKGFACKFMQITAKNNGRHPALHPILAALSIVLVQNGDLGSINRSHPDLNEHEFYDERVVFPSDLSDLLPQVADR